MAINIISVPHNGGLLPDIILLTQCYYPRRIRLNSSDLSLNIHVVALYL